MTMLPQSNARLLSVSRGGFTEDYDRVGGAATVVWTGNIDAYVQNKIVSSFNDAGDLRRVMQTTMIVTDDLSSVIDPGLQAGDQVTLSVGNPISPSVVTAKIQNIANPAELAYLPDYYKCALEEVNAP